MAGLVARFEVYAARNERQQVSRPHDGESCGRAERGSNWQSALPTCDFFALFPLYVRNRSGVNFA